MFFNIEKTTNIQIRTYLYSKKQLSLSIMMYKTRP